MRRLPYLAVVLSALLLVAADGPKQPPSDLASLQGVWTVESAERAGKAEKEPVGDTLTISQDTLKLTLKSSGESQELKFTIDSSKQPKQIDVLIKRGETSATALGIYALQKDSLRICIGRPGNPRPSEFSTKGEGEHIMALLKRVKKG